MQQIDPDRIARAGFHAQVGTLANAAITLSAHLRAARPMGCAPIETNRRRRIYSERLTELHDLTDLGLEWWER